MFSIVRPDKIYAIERDGERVAVVLSNGERVAQSYRDAAEASMAVEKLEERFVEARKGDLKDQEPNDDSESTSTEDKMFGSRDVEDYDL